MTAAELAAVLTAAAGLVAALTALIRAWKTSSALAAHRAEHQAVATSSARPWPPAGSGAE